ERTVLEAVTTLRAQALAQPSRPQLAQVEDALEQALGRLFALREAYPDLKASVNFMQLQRDLVEVEEQLQYARRFYNGAVRDYNDATQRVPDMVVARLAGFGPEEFFEAGDAQRAPVQVRLPCGPCSGSPAPACCWPHAACPCTGPSASSPTTSRWRSTPTAASR